MQDIYRKIEEADMVLIGLGEEFDGISALKSVPMYQEAREQMECKWMHPAYDHYFRETKTNVNENARKALVKLAELLKEKNYFVVSTAMNDVISDIPWKEGRLVRPCGGCLMKQCDCGSMAALQEVTEEEQKELIRAAGELVQGKAIDVSTLLGSCPDCGKPLVLNNIYAEQYNENGYLSQWQLYTKWLQGTLNKNILILELGVGMKFPSVIRFPFEKVAFFNQKASFYRVNEKLYHMSEELKDKGISISQNSIAWLMSM